MICSSPRVQRTDVGGGIYEVPIRFIPACAGNSLAGMSLWLFGLVHPRMCREQNTGAILTIRSNGSSPRVQGTVGMFFGIMRFHRFIPACAGNRNPRVPGFPSVSVHPRVCREQASATHAVQCDRGSSPRVQGTVVIAVNNAPPNRFIPACAGNRPRPRMQFSATAVHPRVCREQWSSRLIMHHQIGSSPRVQGTGKQGTTKKKRERFIPACAGNSLAVSYWFTMISLMLRNLPLYSNVYNSGLSPRVQGTVIPNASISCSGRFIPACAGNSQPWRVLNLNCSVHPRVCREQVSCY